MGRRQGFGPAVTALLWGMTAFGCLACSASERTPDSGASAGSAANAAKGNAGTSIAGSGGSMSTDARLGTWRHAEHRGVDGRSRRRWRYDRRFRWLECSESRRRSWARRWRSGRCVNHQSGELSSNVCAAHGCPSPCASNAGCAYPEGYCTCVGRCSGVAPNPSDPPVVPSWSCRRPGRGVSARRSGDRKRVRRRWPHVFVRGLLHPARELPGRPLDCRWADVPAVAWD